MGETITTYDEILDEIELLKADVQDISGAEKSCWHAHNFYSQMMDVCGEIENAKRLRASYETYSTDETFDKLKQSVDKIHKYCTIVRLDPKTNSSQSTDLSIAEWFLRDCMIGDNTFNISPDYYTDWFDQWLSDINFDLLD